MQPSDLSVEDRRRLLIDFNDTQADFPKGKCIHELIEEQVERRPDATALTFVGEHLSYQELNRRANQLAHQLRSLEVGPEVRVGICVERSAEMVVGIVGILKAGGAYVPLDPSYPRERLAFMLEDARVPVLVSQRHLLEAIPEQDAQVVCLDADWQGVARHSRENPGTTTVSDNLAYVIYTSGSTGIPKGIALRHAGVVNNLVDLNTRFQVGDDDRVLAISSLSFDMCVYEVLGTLTCGATVVMPDPSLAKDPAHWHELVDRHGVTVWNSAPPLLEMLVTYAEGRPDRGLASLRRAILGGDWIPVTLPDRLRALAEGVKVISLGGATEASIHSTVYPIEDVDPEWRSIPYGRPLANQLAYILDGAFEPVSVGVPGQLHIGGVGLARGYFGRPELTAEKFLPNPFGKEAGDRIYQTGDLAQHGSDGNIELLGRIDHQVKIRGHRIELEEIEATLRRHPTVQNAVVVASGEGPVGKRLVAYVVPASDGSEQHVSETPGASEQVEHWQTIYDDTYGTSATHSDPGVDFAGWVSSYTGEPFSEEEMLETLQHTVDRILSLNPERVLEIGCGVGLILFRVAPHCTRYDGTDVSEVAVRRLQQGLEHGRRELVNVSVTKQAAHDLDDVEAGTYDTIVINSVTQHFPGIDYLRTVLERAAEKIQDGGSIFIGDVRSLPLLETFHTSVQLHKARASLPIAELRQRIQKRIRQEKELFVDPDFFVALKRHLPDISQVAVLLRRGRQDNELSMFHYDVVLRLGGSEEPDAMDSMDSRWVDWQERGLTLDTLRNLLVERTPDVLGVKRVPNARLLREVKAVRLLKDDADLAAATVDGLREVLRGSGIEPGVHPEGLWNIANDLPYAVQISWSGSAEADCCDVLFVKHDQSIDDSPRKRLFSFPEEGFEWKPWSAYGNEPIRLSFKPRLASELRDFLGEKLPDYMMPAGFVYMDEFPLSPNGKINRRELPAYDLARPDLEGEYVEPRTPLEEVVAGIWGEVLGLEEVGRDDNFFELGGHSLTATQAVFHTAYALQTEVPLRMLFEAPTLASFAAAIEDAGLEAGVDVSQIAELVIQVQQLSDEEAKALLDRKGVTR